MASEKPRRQPCPVTNALSPHLEITLRGARFLSHSETPQELWGQVVPWTHIAAIGDRALVLGAEGYVLSNPHDAHGFWCLENWEPFLAERLVCRAQLRAMGEPAFRMREALPPDWHWLSRDILYGVAFAALGILGGAWLIPILWKANNPFESWHGAVMIAFLLSFFGGASAGAFVISCKELRNRWHTARCATWSSETVVLEYSNGTLQIPLDSIRSVDWHNPVAITDESGRTYRVWVMHSSFVVSFLDRRIVERHPKLRSHRPSRGVRWLMFIVVFQVLGVLAAAVSSFLRESDPEPTVGPPIVGWLIGGVAAPLLLAIVIAVIKGSERRRTHAWLEELETMRLKGEPDQPLGDQPANPAG